MNMTYTLRILLPLVLFVLLFLLFVKKYTLRFKVVVFFGLCMSAFFVNSLLAGMPLQYDLIKITALNSKNNVSLGKDIFIKKLIIDDKTYRPKKLKKGKWFWGGYGEIRWRPKEDKRQPKNTTQSIEFEVPVGSVRAIVFETGKFRGLVSIKQAKHREQIIDTYDEKPGTKIISIAGSNKSARVLKLLEWSVLYILGIVLLLMPLLWLITQYSKDPLNIILYFKTYWQQFTIGTVALISLIYMHSFAGKYSFWHDEVAQVCFVSKDLKFAVLEDPHAPPLFQVLSYYWYNLVPYGEKWLLLLPELLTAGAVFVLGLTGRKYYNYLIGITGALMAAFSYPVIIQCGHHFRQYALLFLTCALVLYFYLELVEEKDKRQLKSVIAYTCCIVAAAYTHYFGVFILVPYFICDAVTNWRWKGSITKFIIPYIVAGIAYLPWTYYVLKYHSGIVGKWQPIPDFNRLCNLFNFLCGYSNLAVLCFGVGVFACCWRFFKTGKANRLDFKSLVLQFVVFFLILGIYFYATQIAIKSTFWVNRYFLCLLPNVYLLVAIGSVFCGEFLGKVFCNVKLKYAVIVLLLTIALVPQIRGNMNLAVAKGEPYREAADYIYAQSNYIFNGDTVLISTSAIKEEANWEKNGWLEYYITKQGRRDKINLITQYDFNKNNSKTYRRIYLAYLHNGKLSDQTEALLNQFFELKSDNKKLRVKTYERRKQINDKKI